MCLLLKIGSMSNGFDVVAVIVSMISAAVSLLSISLTAKRNMELEMLKNRLEVEKDEAAARRSYQYEARTKLYQEFEPLLF